MVAAGNIYDAIASFEDALRAAPESVEAIAALGAALASAGRLAEAEPHLRRAVALRADMAAHHINLGTLLSGTGRLDEAQRSFKTALRLRPDDVDALIGHGLVLARLGRPRGAERSLRHALHIKPGSRKATMALVNLLMQERDKRAIGVISDHLRRDDGWAEGHGLLGSAHHRFGDRLRAEASLRAALERDRGLTDIHLELGAVMYEDGRFEDARIHYAAALGLAPARAEIHQGIAVVDATLGRFEAAREALREAVRLRPDFVEALSSLGDVLRNMGLADEAEKVLRQALKQRPDDADAQVNLAFALLQGGRFAEGWRLHEVRWMASAWQRRRMPTGVRLWQGEPLAGRHLLLTEEQGLGDTIQFCRFASLIEAGAEITLQVREPLVRLLGSLARVDRVVDQREVVEGNDIACSLLSLPQRLGTGADVVPAIPYLEAPPAAVEAWRSRLLGLRGLRVGLAWAGDPVLLADARRSIALATLACLGDIPGISLISLQKGPATMQIATSRLAISTMTEGLADFAETAALISNLDLVITVDTSIVHVAGALGRPTWLLNRFDSCWRWGFGEGPNAWYPSVRQFRQSSPGDWAGVVERVASALMDAAR